MALPDGPGLNPIELIKFVRDPLACFKDNAARYGDPFTLRFPGIGTCVFTGDPAALKELFTAPPDTFVVGDPDFLGPVLGEHSMLVISGEPHKRQRQLLAPPFHGKRMRAYAQIIRDTTLEVASAWVEDGELNVLEAMQAITMGVIVRAIFGVTDAARKERLEALLEDVMGSVGPLLLFAKPLRKDLGLKSPWGHFLRVREELAAMIDEELARRRAEPGVERDDVLSLMMEARDEAGAPMGDQEIKDELATLLVAGHETTASSLAWAFYFAYREPRIIEAIHRELDALPPEEHASAPFLGACMQESLRIHPVVPETTRRLTRPFTLKGHELPPDSIVLPAIYLTHRNPEIYPDPDKYRPERFLERKFTPYEYLPFGGGHRRCIGYAFAEYEMKVVFATICQRYHLRLAEGQSIEAERRNLAMAPTGGLRMVRGPERGAKA